MTDALLSRRRALGGLSLAFSLPSSLRAEPAGPDIRVNEGVLRGTGEAGIMRFLGVPFAASPIGDLRFRPPAAPPMWHGIRDATRFGDAPIQADPPDVMRTTARAFLGAERSEDCLKLNIWAPAAAGRHPVFVWVHGGGNASGSASQAPFDGTAFAREGIVCVTIGYRVGALGFLELGKLLGPAYRGSGVNGLRDQIAALRWIRSNIGRFGGDPRRITLGGESAGAKNVVTLLASPLTRGLIRSAIVQSGGETVHGLAEAEAVAERFARRCERLPGGVRSLLTMPPSDLLRLQIDAVSGYDRPFPFRAVTGTDLLPLSPIEAFRRGAACQTRLLIGTNRDESIVFLDRAAARQALAQRDLANRDLTGVLPVEARYAAAFPDMDPVRRRVWLVTAEEYGLASFQLAEAHRRCGGATWVYRFDREVPDGPFAGWAPHTAELAYVWDALGTLGARIMSGPPTAEAVALKDAIRSRWCRFIRGDAPWTAYDGEAITVFDREATPGRIDRAEYDLWTSR